MRWERLGVVKAVVVLLFLFSVSAVMQAQTTGTVVGTVTDPTGAVVPGADVELSNPATNLSLRTQTTAAGQYTFPSLAPGEYKITVTAAGFRTAVLTVKVAVGKSSLADITLEVGAVTETVEVTAGARATLQTVDSSVGEVIGSVQFARLPTVQRKATELVYLQVATTPIAGTGAYSGGSVGGARTDQNTAMLDGVNITDLLVGGEVGGNIAMMPLPVEAVEEFRGTVANPDAALGRSGGGHFSFATRRGTNDWHGAAYWYHQNDQANANSWTRNRLGQTDPELKDNRFGFRLGGPIFKDKSFFFLFYEGRRFPKSTDAVRIGISETFRSGILRFRDGTGATVSYPLATSTLCGPGGGLPCDPRGIGMSAVMKQYFGLYPAGNSPADGDGLNTYGIRAPVDVSSRDEVATVRLDHNFTEKWRVNASYMYQLHRAGDTTQIDFWPAVTKGALLKSTAGLPIDPDFFTLGVTGQITSNLTNDFRFGYSRQDLTFSRSLQFSPQVPGTGQPLDLAIVDDPGDTPAPRMRPQTSDMRNRQFADTLTWVKGNHVFTAGASYLRLSLKHLRYDRAGIHPIPVARVESNFRTVPATERPPTCGAGGAPPQTNCLLSADVTRWNGLYSAMLGIWDSTQTYQQRDAEGNPLPVGPYAYYAKWHHAEFMGTDTWRVSPSLTLSYGVNVMYETPLKEYLAGMYMIIDNKTGELIKPFELLAQKAAAAKQGQVFNQQIAYVRQKGFGRTQYPTMFEAGPRAALAWNPSFRSGVFGKLFGDRKTVIRGGYSLQFAQVLTVFTLVSYMEGNQLMGESVNVIAPKCDAAGTPGPGCVPGTSPFRIGVDGAAYLPPAAPFSIPVVPKARDTVAVPPVPFGMTSSSGYDADWRVGRVHGTNLTLQRELPGDLILELGWLGRWGRRLSSTINVNAPPVTLLRDLTGLSNQTYAQAFDALAAQMRAGVPPAAVTPQPWFENLFGAGGTVAVATRASADIIAGRQGNIFVNAIDPMLQALGRPTVMNQQYQSLWYHTTGGYSNYHAFFTSIRKAPTHGLSFIFNWTWAHCFDNNGSMEDGWGGSRWGNPYDRRYAYGDCKHDRRHVVQAYGIYDLPFRKASKLLGGWYLSYIFTAHTGLLLMASQGGDPFGGGDSETVPAIGPVERKGALHYGVAGSGGVGTAGNPAAGGTGLNIFANPEAVFNNLRYFLISQDGRSNRGMFRGMGYWNLDFSVGKQTALTERVNITLAFDFFNIFNHPNFNNPGISFLAPSTFGVVTSQATGTPILGDINVGPRRLQFGFRVEF